MAIFERPGDQPSVCACDYDPGLKGQSDDPWLPYQPRSRWNTGPIGKLNGFQTAPVNWTTND